MNQYLVNDQPLLIFPSLIKKVGVKESILINFIEQSCQSNSTQNSVNLFKNGHWWTRISYTAIADTYPFLGTDRNIQKMILKMEKTNVLVSGIFNEEKTDRTKWYRVNKDSLQ